MKKIIFVLTGAIFMLTLFAVTAFNILPPRPSANGQGTLTVGSETRHFSFHANTMPNGTVKGSGVLNYTAGGRQTKFDITCMTVTGNSAVLSGVITSSSPDANLVGTGCLFQIVDNGEGSNATPDQMSLMFVGYTGGAPACTGGAPALNPIEGGNIQVKN